MTSSLSILSMRPFRATALILALCCVAPSQGQSSLYFSGLYASLGGGIVWTKGRHQLYDPNPTRGVAKSNFSNFGFLGSAHVGYLSEWKHSTVLWGAEIYAIKSFNTMKKRMTLPGGDSQGQLKVMDNASFGPALIMGKLMNPRLLMYGKLAYEIGSISYKYRDLPGSTTSSLDRKIHHKKPTPGAGIRYAVSEHLHVGAEYSLLPVGKKTVQKENETVNGSTHRIESKTLNNRILVNVTWRIFGGGQ